MNRKELEMEEEKVEFKVGDKVKLIKHCYRHDPLYCEDKWTEKGGLCINGVYTVNRIVPGEHQWISLLERGTRFVYPSECFSKAIARSDNYEVQAVWHVTLDATCPKCERDIDLLDAPDFWEAHAGLGIAEHGTDQGNHMEVVCPVCEEGFFVRLTY
jgi:hypothetical protein